MGVPRVVAVSATSVRPTIRLGVTCTSLGSWSSFGVASESRIVTSAPLVLPTTISLRADDDVVLVDEKLMPVRRAVHIRALVVGFHRTTQAVLRTRTPPPRRRSRATACT